MTKPKCPKIYNLISKIHHHPQQLTPFPSTPKVPPGLPWHLKPSSKRAPIASIFEASACEREELPKHPLPYHILCRKEVEAFRMSLMRTKRNIPSIPSKVKINDSLLTNSKHTLYDPPHNNYVTAQDIEQDYLSMHLKHSVSGKSGGTDIRSLIAKHSRYQKRWASLETSSLHSAASRNPRRRCPAETPPMPKSTLTDTHAHRKRQ
jgi:hypothetical protein